MTASYVPVGPGTQNPISRSRACIAATAGPLDPGFTGVSGAASAGTGWGCGPTGAGGTVVVGAGRTISGAGAAVTAGRSSSGLAGRIVEPSWGVGRGTGTGAMTTTASTVVPHPAATTMSPPATTAALCQR